jgi:hypothetical protein
LLRRPDRGDQVGFLVGKPLHVAIEGTVRGYILLSGHFFGGIPVNEPPSLVVESAEMLGNTGELPSDAPIIQPAVLDAPTKL